MASWPDPGGTLDHASGIAGGLLMLWAAFGYSWRKNPSHRAEDSGRTWLWSHVVAGLAGPALVLLHGGFTARGLAGVTTLVMLVVVASGVAGRWIYTALPRRTGSGGGGGPRRALAVWWVLHVPLSMAMLLLALVHTMAELYYHTPAR